MVDICHNVRLVHISIHTMIKLTEIKNVKCYITLNAKNLKQGVFVCVPRLPQSYWNKPDQYLWM